MKSGIYKITNKKNNKIYIGSSKNIKNRFSKHKNLLRSNKHHSIKLQRAWNKYGADNFIFEVIEYCNEDELLDRENYYLDLLLKSKDYRKNRSDYFFENGYNICSSSIKGFTGKHTKESIIKQLETRNIHGIYLVDVDGKIINEHRIMKNSPDSLSSITNSKNNNQTVCDKQYGYIDIDKYYPGYKPKLKVRSVNKIGKKHDIGTIIYTYDIYGRFYKKFNKISDCASHFNTNSSSICRLINIDNKKRMLKSKISYYKFYTQPQNNINMLSVSNGGTIEVYTIFNEYLGKSTIKELNEKLKLNPISIYHVLNGKRKQLKHYIFKRVINNDIV